MRKALLLLLLFLSPLIGAEDLNCFTIIGGASACKNNSVLIAHNEDDPGDNVWVEIQKVPPLGSNQGQLWIRIPHMDFADTHINENGVVICSNACKSREDKGKLTEGGIGVRLRQIMAERAQTARDAVRLAGELIHNHGYSSSGRSYCIADSTEGWILHVVKGKHWIAQRIKDDHVAVLANRYTIGYVDLKDKKNFMGSPDIIHYAIQRNWYNKDRDGIFHFAKVYSDPENYQSEKNRLRQWRGISLLSKQKFKLEQDPLPFSFKPRKMLEPEEIFRILRDHYEGTEHDLSDNYKKGSPNLTSKRTICAKTTRYSFVTLLRSELPREISTLCWLSFRRPDTNAFSPWYPTIESVPSGYHKTPIQPHLAYATFDKLSNRVDKEYKSLIRKVKREWRNYEQYEFKMLRKKEKEFLYLLDKNKPVALKIITNYVHNRELKKWFLASELLLQLNE